MILSDILKRAEKLALDNSPALLTAVGVAGTITTAALTGRASYKLSRRLAEGPPIETLSKKELVVVAWKLYIPPAIVGTATIAAIVGANHIGTRRAAALAAAYTISEQAFGDYREKIVEKLGAGKEQSARDEIAQEKVTADPPSSDIFILGGNVLFKDSMTGRYFESTMEDVKKAQNDTNYELLHNSYVSVGDFHGRLGLPSVDISEEFGWTNDHQIELEFSTTLTPDQRPCIVINFHVLPIRGYNKFY